MILYSTLGCHLCEEAKAIILPVLQERQIPLQELDIAEDDQLMELYGVRIPVVKNPVNHREIGWPFDVQAFTNWLDTV